MSMSVASLDAILAISVYNTEINLLALSILTLSVPAMALRKYYPEEHAANDPKKPVIVHFRPGTRVPKPEKQPPNVENNTVIPAIMGTNVVLQCYFPKYDGTIIWVKHLDGNSSSNNVTLLSANSTTLVDDKRFLVTQDSNNEVWDLHIRYTQASDQGLYECQVCGDSTQSIYVNLLLYEVNAVILGNKIQEVNWGFPIRLSCILNSTNRNYRPKQPTYMFWYLGDRMINYDIEDGAVVREGKIGTELIIYRAMSRHTGNYSCVPSNANQASVLVTVSRSVQQLSEETVPESRAATKKISILPLLLFAFACLL